MIPNLDDQEFAHFQRFIYEAAGIDLAPCKKALVSGRLAKRLRACGVSSYRAYYRLLMSGAAPAEVQTAIELLTTNETYFFREAKHFDLLRRLAHGSASAARPFRVWSAASSSGEEAYSVAMVLADCRPSAAWEVVGSDINTQMLERARRGHYPLERAKHIPPDYLKRYCLKGVGRHHGTLLVERSLRERVQFVQANLITPLPQLGKFDVAFLRNVLIYFDQPTKRQVIEHVLPLLRPGGHLLVGHSETLHGLSDAVQLVAPSVYIRR